MINLKSCYKTVLLLYYIALYSLALSPVFIVSDNEKRLKKDLRRTKALLRDAETVIQKQQSSENSKVTIRQLRNQVSRQLIQMNSSSFRNL